MYPREAWLGVFREKRVDIVATLRSLVEQ